RRHGRDRVPLDRRRIAHEAGVRAQDPGILGRRRGDPAHARLRPRREPRGMKRAKPRRPATGSASARAADTTVVRKLAHERDTYREEMLVQNEQLREAQRLLELSRDRYVDLYDFAPFAYVTLDANGLILNLNLRAAELLGKSRDQILHTPFLMHVSKA